MTNQRDHALDGLRGIAAMAVVLAHLAAITWVPFIDKSITPHIWQYMLWYLGGPAVDLFFVLSGYVVANSLVKRRQDYGVYLLSRYIRILPVAWIAVLSGLALRNIDLIPPEGASAALMALGEPIERMDLIGLSTMLAPIFNAERLNAPLWTIPIELQAAIAMPALVWAVAKWPRVAVPVAVVAMMAVASAINSAYPLFFVAFAYGTWLQAGERGISKRANPLPLAIVGIAILMVRHVLATDDPMMRLICPVGAVFLILAVRRGFGRKMLRRPRIQWLGRISYPLYAVHWPIMAVATMTLGWHIPPALAAALSIPIALLAAAFIRKHVDGPAITLSHMVKSHAPR